VRRFEGTDGRAWDVVVGRESWGTLVALFVPIGREAPIRQTVLHADSQDVAMAEIHDATPRELEALLERSTIKIHVRDMRTFVDGEGASWLASVREENTPRHHGRWYLVMHPADAPEELMAMPEVRWQTRPSAERTLKTMSEFELRRRLALLRRRLART